ncbi:MAG: fructosamine kinase [Chloroflexi bacterium]|nr:MAG: fructosamine kinase [Chloroflexota bacterium]
MLGGEMMIEKIKYILGDTPQSVKALHGGNIGEVYQVNMPDGACYAVKVARENGTLDIEGRMLIYLAENSRLPVPQVYHHEPSILVMSFIEGTSALTVRAQQHAAELLADLHSIRAETFGLPFDTLIGGLHQPNPQTTSWIDFFREHRLLYMGQEAVKAAKLPGYIMKRLEQLAKRLNEFITEPEHPSLIHGDMWTTNILAADGRITGFIDPAVYYAHPEIELAFSTLFGTFDEVFFQRYAEIRPLAPGFFPTRRDVYNLYPLLVHVRLFGSGYVQPVDHILTRLGF